jgi:hypothetical protein
VKVIVMAPKRRARDYTGALAEQIYLHRHETVDQVMARTVRKIPLLFKHHNIAQCKVHNPELVEAQKQVAKLKRKRYTAKKGKRNAKKG